MHFDLSEFLSQLPWNLPEFQSKDKFPTRSEQLIRLTLNIQKKISSLYHNPNKTYNAVIILWGTEKYYMHECRLCNFFVLSVFRIFPIQEESFE